MKYLLYILLTLLLTSCGSTYFYSTLNTSNEYAKKVDNGDFLIETDSLWIAYCFKGENAPVQITIFNKLNEPLFVDWEHSALIIDSISYPYTGAEAMLYESDTLSSQPDYTDAIKNGYMEMSENMSTIPPKTMLSNIPIYLNPDLSKLNKDMFKKGHMGKKSGEVKNINRADFDEQSSPLKFKSFLTIYTGQQAAMLFEQDFYVANQITTKQIKPTDLLASFADRGDFFYSIKEDENNTFFSILGGTALVGFAIIMAGSSDNPSHGE